jgi:poly-gamma-glutamate synthesis protein (capsule biosynthesis protein)
VTAALGGAAFWFAGRPARTAVAPEPPAAPPPRTVRLVAVGDLMLGTSVKRVILEKGPREPFRRFRRFLAEADLAFGNLETPLSDRGAPTPGKSPQSLRDRTNFIFRAPPAAAEGLAWAGFDVVSVANNHTMDYGPVALADTLTSLEDAGVEAVGAGEHVQAAWAPVFLARGGQTFAFFAISDVLPRLSAAEPHRPGVAPARGARFLEAMPAAIEAARERADRVIVSVHWGQERYTGATPKQTRLGRRLIDWGADVVIGHHTHVLGPVERYRGGLIHYSLGNFISTRTGPGGPVAWEVTLPPSGEPRETSYAFTPAGKAYARR